MDWKRILIGKWSWKRPFISLASIYLFYTPMATPRIWRIHSFSMTNSMRAGWACSLTIIPATEFPQALLARSPLNERL